MKTCISLRPDKPTRRYKTLLGLLLGFFCLPHVGHGQGEADWWYFQANVGLHFSPGQALPTPIDSTHAFGSAGFSEYSSISDPCGNLLFVATPDSIFDSSFSVMPNGTLITSSERGFWSDVVIIPEPGSNDRYYIFYTHQLYPILGPWVLSRKYSIVDMSLNGGMGDVVVKNVLLHPNSSIFGAATLHDNNEDIWVISTDEDSVVIYSHLITSAGIQPPVISTFPGFPVLQPGGRLGDAVFSPKGNKLAMASERHHLCLLFDFDSSTGQLSNPISIGSVIGPGFVTNPHYGGVEFSPNGSKLYRTTAYEYGPFVPQDFIQFDVSSNNQATIQASGVSVGPLFQPPIIGSMTGTYHKLQTGPDGNLYVKETWALPMLHRIESPNSPGLNCNFQYHVMDLGITTIQWLSAPFYFPYYPWFMLKQNQFEQTADSGYMKVCLPDSAHFGVTQSWRLDSVVWDFGVPGMAPVVGSSDSIAFLYPAPGIYPVQALVFRGCPTRADTILDTVEVFMMPELDFPSDSAICQGSIVSLDVSTPTASYLWQDGSANATYQTGTAGLIWVEVSNLCGTVRDSLDLAVHQPGSVSLGADTSYLCAGDSVVYQLVLDQGSFLWEDGSDDPNRTIYAPGIYSVEAWNACDTLRDTVEILPLGLPFADLGTDTALCQGDLLLLSAAAPQGAVIWSTGSTDPQISVGSTDTYFVEAVNACGLARDTVEVEVHDPPVADLGPDQVRCEGDVLDLDLSIPFGSYLWENGSTDATRSLSQSGLYHIAVTTACGTERDSLDLVFETPPVVDLGADSSLCPGETMSLAISGLTGVSYLWSTGDTSATIVVGSPGDYELTVQAQACVSRDTISIAGLALPSVDLGADTLLCDGNSLILDATFAGATYRWSSGASTPQLTVDTPGSYEVMVENRCGSASDTISIQTGINPDIDLGLDRTACTGDTVWLDASTDFATYLWQDGSEEAQVGAIQTDLYQVSVSTICGTATQDVFLDFLDLPQLNLGPDTLICEGEFYILEASTVTTPSRALTTIQWPDGSSGPEYVFSEPGAYQVLALNDCGETADTLLLQFRDCDCHVYVASAFSPNGDGHNEVFKPGLSCDFTDYQFSIYHRWGKQVFTTADPSRGWNGLNAPEGVYAWTVSYRWIGRGGVEVGEVRSGTVFLGR